jgi:hypothetical protein
MGLRGGRLRGRSAAGAGPGCVAMRGCSVPALAPFPVQGRSSMWTMSCCWGGWLVLVRNVITCRVVSVGLQSGAALINVCLDVR